MKDFFLRKVIRLQGTIGRRTYALCGVLGFALKFGLDSMIAHSFGKPWRLINYWHLAGARFEPNEVAVLLTAALPFVWFGVATTLLRTRDAGVPAWTVVLFFIPIVNLGYFGTLLFLHPRPPRSGAVGRADLESRTALESAIVSVVITTAFTLAFAGLTTWLFQSYGLILFVGLPFIVGFMAAMVHGYRAPRSAPQIAAVVFTSLLFAAGGFLALPGRALCASRWRLRSLSLLHSSAPRLGITCRPVGARQFRHAFPSCSRYWHSSSPRSLLL